MPQLKKLLKRLERLNAIGIALSAERDAPRLLEMILLGANLNNLNDEVGGKLVWNGGPKGELGLP